MKHRIRTFYSNRGGTYLFPLYESAHKSLDLFAPGERQHNLAHVFLKQLEAATPSPVEAFRSAFATLSSLTYRIRYSGLLKIGYPRVPLPGSTDLFRQLARLGEELVGLHLMNSPTLERPITEYAGPKNPEVGRAGWSDETVWLNAGKINAREEHRATKPGTIGFTGVPKEV